MEKGDQVKVICGKYKDQVGKIVEVHPDGVYVSLGTNAEKVGAKTKHKRNLAMFPRGDLELVDA